MTGRQSADRHRPSARPAGLRQIGGRVTGSLTSTGYRAGWWAVRRLPEPAARTAFRRGADWAYGRQGEGARRLGANLRTVVGPDMPDSEFAELHRAALRSYARYWREAFRLPSVPANRLLDTLVLDGEELLAEAAQRGKGLVLALPHAGNWDHAGAWAALKGYRPTAVAERLKPEDLYRRFVAYREKIGIQVVPHTGGRSPLDALTEKVSEGRMITLLADRDLSTRGVEVEFFGVRTRMPPGPALLALRTGAPLLAAELWYEGSGDDERTRVRVVEVDPAVVAPDGKLVERVAAVTQALAKQFEAGIARHPADWHMLQRMWRTDAPGGVPADPASAATGAA